MKSLSEQIKENQEALAAVEEAQAQLLLELAGVGARQAEQDEALAALLLQGLGGGGGDV